MVDPPSIGPDQAMTQPLMTAAWCWILLRSMWFTGIRRQLHWRGRTYDAGRTKFGAD